MFYYHSFTLNLTAATGHHWVWETSQILHRDVSYGNIMFYREGSGDDEKVVEVLTNWDLAEEQGDNWMEVKDSDRAVAGPTAGGSASKGTGDGEPEDAEMKDVDGGDEAIDSPEADPIRQQKVESRAGTGPFMAVDLLEDTSIPRHLYRHDLESFFWVLTWFVAVFKPD